VPDLEVNNYQNTQSMINAKRLEFVERRALNRPFSICSACYNKLSKTEVNANEMQKLKINKYLCEHCYLTKNPDAEWILVL